MAQLSAANIARQAGGKASGSGAFLIRCPNPNHGRGRGDLHPSCLVRDDGNGQPRFHCFAGCDWRQVREGAVAKGWISSTPGTSTRFASGKEATPREKQNARVKAMIEIAHDIWASSQPGENTPAHNYLVHARGIPNPPMDRLRYISSHWHSESNLWLPALVAPIQRSDRDGLQGVHLIYLQQDGGAKATVTPAKITLGQLKHGGVWLGDVTDTIVVAEGIETALSVQAATGLPSVATLCAYTLPSLVLPERARSVVIAADPGQVGERWAVAAADRWVAEGRRVRIALPDGRS